jgi:hypothetical protein
MGNAPRINVGGGYRNWLARKIAPRENSPYLSKVAESGGGSLGRLSIERGGTDE